MGSGGNLAAAQEIRCAAAAADRQAAAVWARFAAQTQEGTAMATALTITATASTAVNCNTGSVGYGDNSDFCGANLETIQSDQGE